jgi:selenocysteine lyase/cysteine desulfurase
MTPAKPYSAYYEQLENSVLAALETYSNVHRGSGHFSMVTTDLFEHSRLIVLDFMGLSSKKYVVVFCTPRRARILKDKLKAGSYREVSSREIGLPLGVIALAVKKSALPKGIPFQTGGGTTRLISGTWIIWADAPDRYEAGTPAVINIIALAKALLLKKQTGTYPESNKNENVTVEQLLYHDDFEGATGKELLEKLRQSVIGQGIKVPILDGIVTYTNLDNAASTPALLPVWQAARQAWTMPSSLHSDIVLEVKSICAGFLGASANNYDFIFTSNTTEAVNLASESLGREDKQGFEPVVLNTLLEHNTNDLPWRMLPGFTTIRLPIDQDGFFDLAELERLLREYNQDGLHADKRIRLVAVSGASNVLGTCNDLAAVSRIVHRYGARLLVDAAQLISHREIRMDDWGIDYLAFSGHKAYAPFGTGALVVRKGMLQFNPQEMELIYSSGEENLTGIAALGKSMVLLQRVGMYVICEEERALTEKTLHCMAKVPGIRVFGIRDEKSAGFPNKSGVISFRMEKSFANEIAKRLAEQNGIGIRYGCHCSHVLVKHLLNLSPFLENLQRLIITVLWKVRLPGIARVSFGIGNRPEDIEKLVLSLKDIASMPRDHSNHNKELKISLKKYSEKILERVF